MVTKNQNSSCTERATASQWSVKNLPGSESSVSSRVKLVLCFFSMPMQICQKAFMQQVHDGKASLFVWDLLKHKGNSKWETRHISTSSIKLFLQVSHFPLHPFVYCRCLSLHVCEIISTNFVGADFVCCRASQQKRRSPEALTRVTFISLVGCKGPLQRREIRAAPCLLVF